MRVKTQSLVGEYWHVDEDDPAIDKSEPKWRAAFERALETGDLNALPLKNGASDPPAIFRLRHLSAREYRWLLDYDARREGVNEMMWEAVALALIGVRGVTDQDGRPLELERGRFPGCGSWQSAKPEQVNALMADEDGRYEADRLNRLAERVLVDTAPRKG
ncbi:MAG TPA: hypothetical protein VK607_10735 [Kofleriaceae bacterium]|nr:hypothetical protein [Kofleriaceae bacterium]